MKKKLIPVAMAALLTQGIDGMAKPAISCHSGFGVMAPQQEPSDSVPLAEEAVKEAVALQLKMDKKEILLKSDISRDLGADSLDIVEIVLSLEKKYGFEFSDEELNGLKKVQDLVVVIQKREKAKK